MKQSTRRTLQNVLVNASLSGCAVVIVIACTTSNTGGSEAGCKSDTDCKGERICRNGTCTDPSATNTSSSGDGGGTTTPTNACSSTACTGDHCSALENWCSWAFEVGYLSYKTQFSTCSNCVASWHDAIESKRAPNGSALYCSAMYKCWSNCLDQNRAKGTTGVSDCVRASCDNTLQRDLCP